MPPAAHIGRGVSHYRFPCMNKLRWMAGQPWRTKTTTTTTTKFWWTKYDAQGRRIESAITDSFHCILPGIRWHEWPYMPGHSCPELHWSNSQVSQTCMFKGWWWWWWWWWWWYREQTKQTDRQTDRQNPAKNSRVGEQVMHESWDHTRNLKERHQNGLASRISIISGMESAGLLLASTMRVLVA